MKIYLVRHGETDWNKVKRWQGHTDIPLNETGIEQANALAQTIVNYSNISIIYASPLIRAYKTAEILNQALNVEIVVRERLKEVCLGVWEGMDYENVVANYPTDYKLWCSHQEGVDPNLEVESLPALQQRALLELETLRKINTKDFMIVGHGAWIGNLLRQFLQLDGDRFLHIENAKLIEIKFDEESGQYHVVTDLKS